MENSSSPYLPYKVLYHTDKVKSIIEDERTAPIYIRLKPTNTCNQQCYYCLYKYDNTKGRVSKKSDYIEWGKMQEILSDFKDIGVKAVTLSGGGDPLCYPYIDRLLDSLINSNIEYSIITNGQALEGHVAEKLYNANWIRVSLDATNSNSYYKTRNVNTFDKVISNITHFAKMKNTDCELGINFVVTAENKNDIYEMCKMSQKIGVNNIKFSPMLLKENFTDYHKTFKDYVSNEINRAKNDFSDKNFLIVDKYSDDIYYNQQEKKCYERCYISEYFAVIGADLKVYMCHHKVYISDGEIGDISEQSFKDLWFSTETVNKIKNFRPNIICKDNQCIFDERNKLLDTVINSDKRFVHFI